MLNGLPEILEGTAQRAGIKPLSNCVAIPFGAPVPQKGPPRRLSIARLRCRAPRLQVYDVRTALAGCETAPSVHQFSTLIEEVCPPVRALHRVLDLVGQRRFR